MWNIYINLRRYKKRAVKWILFERFEHYSDEEDHIKVYNLDLLPMNTKFILSDLLLFHRIVYNNICINMPDYIVLDINSHDRPSRLAMDEGPDYLKYKSIERSNIVAFANSFFYRSIGEWNILPLKIREISSYEVFKDKLKAHLWNVLVAKPD